jgi:hypothetical protein
VDGAALLDEMAASYRRHVVMTPHAASACALWTIHTHALEAAEVTPRLAVVSPAKRCGKTTLLAGLGELVARALHTANVTTAATFRVLDAGAPTLLIDEADTFLAEREELRGVLNSGHRRETAYVIRCVGDEHEPTRFATWGAVAIATIGHDAIPSTLHDRSIQVALARRAKHEHVERWAHRDRAALTRMRRQCVRWTADHLEELRAAPVLDDLDDRAADNWGALLAIADAAGGEWPKRARAAALVLSGVRDASDDDLGVALLTDVRHVFDALSADRVRSGRLVEQLVALADRPWGECERGRELNQYTLGRRLRRFGIAPSSVRFEGEKKTKKGYLREWFADAWGRYLPETREEIRNMRNDADKVQESGVRRAGTPDTCSECLSSRKPCSPARVSAVPDLIPYRKGEAVRCSDARPVRCAAPVTPTCVARRQNVLPHALVACC